MKKVLKISGVIIGSILLVLLAYIVYVQIDYYRIEDRQSLDIANYESSMDEISTGKELTAISYNIGFCAYTPDFTFFMDGGTQSRAKDEASVREVAQGVGDFLAQNDADVYMIQEVDFDSTRSYHVDERVILKENLPDYCSTFAVNYDSPYLMYPILSPHGKSRSGLLTLSKYDIKSSVRRSLPVQDNYAKILDLDRCYSVNKIPTDNGKYLCIYNMHLSAYTTDPTIGNKQLEMLYKDMKLDYAKGNYVICGGDFNKDLLGDSSKYFGVSGEDYSWAKSFPFDSIPENFKLIAPFDESNPAPSCRNANMVYKKGENFVLTIDGFIVSDNVKVSSSNVIDNGFIYSDHNPVYLKFKLL